MSNPSPSRGQMYGWTQRPQIAVILDKDVRRTQAHYCCHLPSASTHPGHHMFRSRLPSPCITTSQVWVCDLPCSRLSRIQTICPARSCVLKPHFQMSCNPFHPQVTHHVPWHRIMNHNLLVCLSLHVTRRCWMSQSCLKAPDQNTCGVRLCLRLVLCCSWSSSALPRKRLYSEEDNDEEEGERTIRAWRSQSSLMSADERWVGLLHWVFDIPKHEGVNWWGRICI